MERYFLMRLSRGDEVLGESVGQAHRREGIVAWRWWSLGEIERTTEEVFPVDLGERLRKLPR